MDLCAATAVCGRPVLRLWEGKPPHKEEAIQSTVINTKRRFDEKEEWRKRTSMMFREVQEALVLPGMLRIRTT